MCIVKFNNNKCKMINRSTLGRAVQGVLTQAKVEQRLICGLLPAINYLQKALTEEVLLCVLPQTRPGDAATHMQTVLLQAFCYENAIPVIQVDSSEKLAEYCGIAQERKDKPAECPCALITLKDPSSPDKEIAADVDLDIALSPSEQILTDFYECTIEEYPRPIIELPR